MIKHCAAARAILSLPLDARRKALSRQQRYDAFRRRFGHVVPRPLPEAIRYCQCRTRPGSARSPTRQPARTNPAPIRDSQP